MVRTRSRSYASDEDVKPPGSLPGGPTPIHNRVRELRDTIARLATPRMPASRVFAMLGADSPGRRESWEGLTTPVKPTGVVYEGQGSLQRADELPSASETVQHTFAATPRISPAAPATAASTPSTLGVVESVKNFEFPLEADKTTESVADASFRTADPESAPATPAKPASPPPTPPPGLNEPKPAVQEAGKPGKRAEKVAEVTPAAAEPTAAPPSKPKLAPVPRRNRSPVSGPFPEPTVKFRAPASGDASSGTWKTVSEGAVVDTEGWVTSVKRGAPSKTASEVVAVPVITGPQQFPDWYLHYNSGDNSGATKGAGSDKEEGPSTRPSSRASGVSSMPSLVSVTDSSNTGPFRSEPATRQPTPEPTPVMVDKKPSPTTVSAYVKWLRSFSEAALTKYYDEGMDAAIAYMCSLFPENEVELMRQWLASRATMDMLETKSMLRTDRRERPGTLSPRGTRRARHLSMETRRLDCRVALEVADRRRRKEASREEAIPTTAGQDVGQDMEEAGLDRQGEVRPAGMEMGARHRHRRRQAAMAHPNLPQGAIPTAMSLTTVWQAR
ncbi:hypothetical protein AURDEDRAFT_169373 [Auricularia subglabra TFB-10046 SS5]|nr:hypothetical protein AURDEDRAFT_169373 [Auricularia subglabra TFB-10046 SS5]